MHAPVGLWSVVCLPPYCRGHLPRQLGALRLGTYSHHTVAGPWVAELLLLSSLMTRCAYVSACRPHHSALVDLRRSHQSSRAVLLHEWETCCLHATQHGALDNLEYGVPAHRRRFTVARDRVALRVLSACDYRCRRSRCVCCGMFLLLSAHLVVVPVPCLMAASTASCVPCTAQETGLRLTNKRSNMQFQTTRIFKLHGI